MDRSRRDEPRLLILETSGKVGCVAVAEGTQIAEVRNLEESRRHARDLAPAVAELCAARSWRVRDLDAVFVSLGPGSYTGLRVGIMTAKMLAYASRCIVIGIETFAAIAHQAPPEAVEVEVLADAQQMNVYVQRWSRRGSGWTFQPLAIRSAKEWLSELQPGVWATGPGVAPYEAQLPATNRPAPHPRRVPQPESLLAVGLERWRLGETDDPWTLEPRYLRPSNAEENWDRRTEKRG
jgi:tRNA threonylcarbamoyladenosine biosynthesis protein TsaB